MVEKFTLTLDVDKDGGFNVNMFFPDNVEECLDSIGMLFAAIEMGTVAPIIKKHLEQIAVDGEHKLANLLAAHWIKQKRDKFSFPAVSPLEVFNS